MFLTHTAHKENKMEYIYMVPLLGAAGYSLLYMLLGGGLVGAVIIFFIAKMLGK
jgi:hypothetical protein